MSEGTGLGPGRSRQPQHLPAREGTGSPWLSPGGLRDAPCRWALSPQRLSWPQAAQVCHSLQAKRKGFIWLALAVLLLLVPWTGGGGGDLPPHLSPFLLSPGKQQREVPASHCLHPSSAWQSWLTWPLIYSAPLEHALGSNRAPGTRRQPRGLLSLPGESPGRAPSPGWRARQRHDPGHRDKARRAEPKKTPTLEK